MKKLPILFLLLILSSCKLTNKYENREEDKVAAEKITTELFDLLKKNDYENASKLFGEDFYKITSKEDLNKIFTITNDKLGKLETVELKDWKTSVAEGELEGGMYSLFYICKFEKDNGTITVNLKKNKDSEILIFGYNVNSPSILK